MFTAMRRIDRQVSTEETIRILEKCEYGVLSTVNQEGYSYGVPLSYIYKDGSIYFHSANDGYKLKNIAGNGKVSFCVVGQKQSMPEKFTTSYESVIVFGQATVVLGQEKQEALLGLISKYGPDYLEQGKEYIRKSQDRTTVIKITVEHMTGKVRPQ
ncbi:pyridoxamine 5'-phosphate oxidase family protein [Sporomusa sphaeroides]|uniref:Pyridoxamine 5'-phosphate oxidase n=1 Tax=Sporomusa sphaeroides DSM 2875 TaxID=1337886 RepID=A0ABP2CB12_9FIRM|nr:pyridoxamine 5'-phosphate oxidase family protein [Sporomusa sphaeroides]OLS57789.1 pyridoxamine 5'-phosphate oxidase [Sporomusa sphaeroides DSM 2875]CVK20996.1 Pyridoxamine 5'-phosphate oxidase [Sporomusa sphaeroides DSM 2875]